MSAFLRRYTFSSDQRNPALILGVVDRVEKMFE